MAQGPRTQNLALRRDPPSPLPSHPHPARGHRRLFLSRRPTARETLTRAGPAPGSPIARLFAPPSIPDTGSVKTQLAALLATAALLSSTPAFGWGREGHIIIGKLASLHLSSQARSQVAALLNPGETLESVSTWADEVRSNRPESSTWHYINIPITANSSWRKYCPDSGCVVSIIPGMERRLADRSLSRDQRREALFFLVHFIADLHQPMHIADMGDRGGNDVPTVYNSYAGNLHGTWDTGLILGYKQTDAAMFDRIALRAGFWERRRITRGGPEQWIWEAHAISRDVAYPDLPKQRPALLGQDYARAARPHVERQLRRAGLRTASVLNRILGR
ncbi:MAG: hypothetical protein C0504_00720 [Candidatus Solibacter sp.]|nr:hypothetical protein [Candidatus Solibacter sp.]